MRYSKRRVKTCKKRKHAKNCKCYRCRNAMKKGATKRRVKTCNRSYKHRRIMKGG